MPRIFDNIESSLLPAIREGLKISDRSDFCIGYFNLRGWKQIASNVEHLSGENGEVCRILVGMHRLPSQELTELFGTSETEFSIDNNTAIQRKRELAIEFRDQLTVGIPTTDDEAALQMLARQIKSGKVQVKLFLRHPLHAKLYLLHRTDPISPLFGYVGSSNLTMAGLSKQGELNVDVIEQDACRKLYEWFEARWNDRFCLDISKDLVEVIGESWAREDLIPPYHIYLKMAYHLAEDAREGLTEFRIPRDFGNKLFEYQEAAVKIAAHHLNTRNGVLIGDVVGLGKTLMASALARIFEDDQGLETLIICPPNLVRMWEDYRDTYRMRARILPISRAISMLPELKIFRIVLIDESQNLRNREGKTYKVIQNYIERNRSKVIMLSATPYNKTFTDLSNQLRLFIFDEKQELTVRPECLIRDIGAVEFATRYQCSPKSLDAFDKSEYADDWRELMRLYMVRRTRSFILNNYAKPDSETGRKYLLLSDGRKSYFPTRIPKTVKFTVNDADETDQYAKLYSETVVNAISSLELPRYGLANYIDKLSGETTSAVESEIIEDLSRSGKRLMGFCRTGLFKRLESSGYVFLQSVSRHILRNFVFIHALENNLPVPIGAQSADLLGAIDLDTDFDENIVTRDDNNVDSLDTNALNIDPLVQASVERYRSEAKRIYESISDQYKTRFRWLKSDYFTDLLLTHLTEDALALIQVMKDCGKWNPDKDTKLAALASIIRKKHPKDKILLFSQYADTITYLSANLKNNIAHDLESATGNSDDPTSIAWRFSPISNGKIDYASREGEIRVLLATDVLSEGQNLQDCSIVVNYDLPWAIIRLIQRVGRVDRIGQESETVRCYSFLPAEGVERLITLRTRIKNRLRQNAEVVGTDEAFFEDDTSQVIVDLYNEKSGILDGGDEGEVDLASFAFQIWKNAIDADPSLKRKIEELPSVVFSSKPHFNTDLSPSGALVYVRTGIDNDALAWVDSTGNIVSESQYAILKAAECKPGTPALPRQERHHEIVAKGVEHISKTESNAGGQLGKPSGARYKAYIRLKRYTEREAGSLFVTETLIKAIEQIYNFPLKSSAKEAINRQLKAAVSDERLADLVVMLYDEDNLCQVSEDGERPSEPRIICSLGLISGS